MAVEQMRLAWLGEQSNIASQWSRKIFVVDLDQSLLKINDSYNGAMKRHGDEPMSTSQGRPMTRRRWLAFAGFLFF